jgi:hypothetical protein
MLFAKSQIAYFKLYKLNHIDQHLIQIEICVRISVYNFQLIIDEQKNFLSCNYIFTLMLFLLVFKF